MEKAPREAVVDVIVATDGSVVKARVSQTSGVAGIDADAIRAATDWQVQGGYLAVYAGHERVSLQVRIRPALVPCGAAVRRCALPLDSVERAMITRRSKFRSGAGSLPPPLPRASGALARRVRDRRVHRTRIARVRLRRDSHGRWSNRDPCDAEGRTPGTGHVVARRHGRPCRWTKSADVPYRSTRAGRDACLRSRRTHGDFAQRRARAVHAVASSSRERSSSVFNRRKKARRATSS